jgi:hypothetical protein
VPHSWNVSTFSELKEQAEQDLSLLTGQTQDFDFPQLRLTRAQP